MATICRNMLGWTRNTVIKSTGSLTHFIGHLQRYNKNVRSNCQNKTKINHVLTKENPTVTSFQNMYSVVLDYRTLHHLTHTTVTRLVSYWTARLRYLLLTVLSFKSLSVLTPSTYHQRFLNVRWAFKLITYGYEPPVTDVSKPNKHMC
jgi:hypothetical protein